MSQFALPRVYFRGLARVNSPTGNNLKEVVDPVHARLAMNKERAELVSDLERATNRAENHWNYYGDFSFEFRGAKVEAIVTAQGRVDDDPLIGASVSIRNGIMVDADPFSAFTTQVFAERVLIGTGDFSIVGDISCHAARWYHARRVKGLRGAGAGGAVFQARISNVRCEGRANTAFLHSDDLGSPGDLFIQYTLTNGRARYSNVELAALFFHGRPEVNPFELEVEGIVCPAEPEDLDSVSLQRILVPRVTDAELCPSVAFVKRRPADHNRPERLLIDASNTFAFSARAEDAVPATLTEARVEPFGVVVDLTRENVRAHAGIVEVELEAARYGSQALSLFVAGQGGLHEPQCHLSAEPRCLYIEAGDEGTIKLRVHATNLESHGNVHVAVVPARMSEFEPASVASIKNLAPTDNPDFKIYNGAFAKGQLELNVTGERPGAVHLVFFCGAQRDLRSAVNSASQALLGTQRHLPGDGFATVRVLPNDNRYDTLGVPRFSTVYRDVLMYYDVVFPYMSSRHFQFSDQAAVETNAKQILARLDLPASAPLHMPPSRDMSKAKRQWLRRFLVAAIKRKSRS